MKFLFSLLMLTILTSCIGVDEESISKNLMKNKSSFEELVKDGKKTGIVFWKSNCGLCIRELQALNQGEDPIIAINVGNEPLDKEISKLKKNIDDKLKGHIQFQKNTNLQKVVKEKVGVNFVPFTVVVKDNIVSGFHAGYTDSL